MNSPKKSIQQLNFLEVAALARLAEPELVGSVVDQLIIAERPECIDGYIKGEFIFRLRGKRDDRYWVNVIRPQHALFFVGKGRGPKASSVGTQSAFQQQLSKELRSKKIIAVRSIENERIVLFDFDDRHTLALILIPASPEAVLLERDHRDEEKMTVIASSLLRREPGERFQWPEARSAPQGLQVREPFSGSSLWAVHAEVEAEVRAEAFALRKKRVANECTRRTKDLEKRIEQARKARSGSEQEPDFERLGELAKANWYALPEKGASEWVLADPVGDESVRVSVNPSLDSSDNLKRLFQMAKRKNRRVQESREREKLAADDLSRLKKIDLDAIEFLDFEALAKAESALGFEAEKPKNAKALKHRPEIGRSFVSKDGFEFFAGRSLEENLDLTFKVAKGNDVWMHCKFYRGTHVIIPVPPGKTVSLDTLLDAAHVVVVMSGGAQWGKTEVDYTFRKFVKRIKGSSQVSYTQNKTLVVSNDPERLKRLFSRHEA